MTNLDRLRSLCEGEAAHKLQWFHRKTKIPMPELERLLIRENGFGRHGPLEEWIEFNPLLLETMVNVSDRGRENVKRRSLTNSRHYENVPLRHQYLDDNQADELLPYFPREGRDAIVELPGQRILLSAYHTDSQEAHHIAGGANGADRWDLVTNLAAVNYVTHKWLERFRPEGFILGMRLKLDKSEWEEREMCETVLGLRRPGASVVSYLSIRKPKFPWVQKILDGLIEWERKALANAG